MAIKKSFLLRMDQEVLGLLQRWADNELRSLNGQVEYILREALQKRGRLKDKKKDYAS
ncbi:MAG: Arc family DNA-binding protein [candidate division Zixibacteria bacterium]|nr:Arc family DNA-binding protein [candidate division Zixibacteria bacterium]